MSDKIRVTHEILNSSGTTSSSLIIKTTHLKKDISNVSVSCVENITTHEACYLNSMKIDIYDEGPYPKSYPTAKKKTMHKMWIAFLEYWINNREKILKEIGNVKNQNKGILYEKETRKI